MTLFNLNIRQSLFFSTLIGVLFLLSCATGKKTMPPPPPVAVITDTIEHYSCGFKTGTFTGTLPCFGDECGEFGAPLTMLLLGKQHQVIKRLKRDHQVINNTPGKWLIREDCIIEIIYEDGTQEYYKFHEGINKLERLTPAQQPFPGTLNKHNYLSKLI